MESLERLQGLYADLVAFSEAKLANIERLWQELEETLDDFRRLLDPPPVTSADRDAYNGGKVTVDGREYGINEEFRHISTALKTALEIDEVEAAKILISDYGGDISADADFIAQSVCSFHDRRDLVLQNLRMVLQLSQDGDIEEDIKLNLQDVVKHILEIDTGVVGNASLYTNKCLATMKILQIRQLTVANQIQNRPVSGQLANPEQFAILEFQKASFFKQHEALGCILAYLFRGDYNNQEDLRKLVNAANDWNRMDFDLVHYLPALCAGLSQCSSNYNSSELNLDQMRSLNSFFGNMKQNRPASSIEAFQAALMLVWTIYFGGWLGPTKENDKEMTQLAQQLKTSLDEFALEFFLALCSSMTTDMWRHPARQEMVDLLLSDSPNFAFEGEQPSQFFREMCMECLEEVAEAWISNMPDTIRHLKNEEDDQRLMRLTAMQDGAGFDPNTDHFGPLHLESFLILISFAFEGRPESSEQWWEDVDSNLYGFLQWASKRQTVPRVGAFCEMLCSIAEGEEGASAAHKFLLEESIQAPNSRTRRMPSLNFAQIFAELELYSRKVHEKSPTSQLANRKVLPTDMNEAESPVMLSTYLRLLAHLCRQTSATRDFIYAQATLDFPRTLLLLSAGPVPSYLRASAFAALDALLTDKDLTRSHAMWKTLDEWAANGLDMAISTFAKPGTVATPTIPALQNTLGTLSLSPDQYDAFVGLLRNLLTPVTTDRAQDATLPFPEDLGSAYRSAGVTPYLDFVFGQIFIKRLPEITNETQSSRCAFRCLDLVATVLESFNESYADLLDRSMNQRDTSSLVTRARIYAQRHPFGRTMQWILGSETSSRLMKRLHVAIASVELALPSSPLIQCLQRCIDIINLAMDLQPTYYDLVRPLLKENTQERSVGVQTSVEDAIFANPDLILDLCQYAASDQLDLSLRSLALLQKFSSSPKLNNHFLSSAALRRNGERIVDMLGPNSSTILKGVSSALVSRLRFSTRDLEGGPESPSYRIKDALLAFFNACLDTQPELANVAHVLLGFSRLGERLTPSDSLASGDSVFDTIIELVRDYPHGNQLGYVSWLVHMKAAAIQTLRHLWSSPISSEVTIAQSRRYRLFEALFGGLDCLSESTMCDGLPIHDAYFWGNEAADTLPEILTFRSSVYQYCSQELQACASANLPTTLKQHLSTMLGKSVDMSGVVSNHLNIFDLGDFLDINLSISPELGDLRYFTNVQYEDYTTLATEDGPRLFNVPILRQLVRDEQRSIHDKVNAQTGPSISLEDVDDEAEHFLATLTAANRLKLAQDSWRKALKSYMDMLVAVIEFCPFEPASKVQFIIQNLQLLLPKLDSLIAAESMDTLELARAADTLMFALSSPASPHNKRTEGIITEKLFQLFRTCIDGVLMSNSDSSLRSILYSIASQYLTRITASSPTDPDLNTKARSNSMDTIRSSSHRLINIIADDADDGTDTCRMNALNLLSLLASLARGEKSTYILDALVKANVLEILIDPLKHISEDFQTTDPSHRAYLLSVFEARMLLLLQISRTRPGATAVLDAGLITAIKDSLLFRADPDLGFSLPTTTMHTNTVISIAASNAAKAALRNYYLLLSPTLRLLLSVFTSRGTDNAQSQNMSRTFLTDNRNNMLGLLKRYAGVNGKVDEASRKVVADCVRSYVGLCVIAGFTEWEDEFAMEGFRGNGGVGGGGYGVGRNGGFS
jgi:nuclear pore complex protein Nup205